MCLLVVRFQLKTALKDLLIGDSALLLCVNKSEVRSRNSAMVPIFQDLLLLMSVYYCVSRK